MRTDVRLDVAYGPHGFLREYVTLVQAAIILAVHYTVL